MKADALDSLRNTLYERFCDAHFFDGAAFFANKKLRYVVSVVAGDVSASNVLVGGI
jgi:hypothetical protein